MRNYKNKTKFFSKKLFIASLVIAAQIFIFSGQREIGNKSSLNVASAAERSFRTSIYLFDENLTNINPGASGGAGIATYFKYNSDDLVDEEAVEQAKKRINNILSQNQKTIIKFENDIGEKFANGTIPRTNYDNALRSANFTNKYLKIVCGYDSTKPGSWQAPQDVNVSVVRKGEQLRQGLLEFKTSAIREFNEGLSKPGVDKADKAVNRVSMDALEVYRITVGKEKLKNMREMADAVKEMIDEDFGNKNTSGGRRRIDTPQMTLAGQDLYAKDVVTKLTNDSDFETVLKADVDKGVFPVVLNKEVFNEFFDLLFRGVENFKWSKKLLKHEKTNLYKLITALVLRYVAANSKQFRRVDAAQIYKAAKESMEKRGFDVPDAFENDVVDVITKGASGNDSKNYELLLFGYIYSVNTDSYKKFLEQYKKEDKDAKKEKEFKELYINLRRQIKRFSGREYKKFWTKMMRDLSMYEGISERLNTESGVRAGRERVQGCRAFFAYILNRVAKEALTGSDEAFKGYAEINNSEGMGPAKDYVSKNDGEEDETVNVQYTDLNGYINYVGSLEDKFRNCVTRLDKLFGRKSSDEETSLFSGTLGGTNKKVRDCTPLFEKFKNYYKELKSDLESYKKENEKENADKDKRERAVKLRQRYAGKIIALMAEILAYVKDESKLYAKYVNKINDERAGTVLKEAIRVYLEEVIRNGKIYDIKDVYKYAQWTGGYTDATVKMKTARTQIISAISVAVEKSKRSTREKTIFTRAVKRILFDEIMYLYLIKNCFKDLYGIGLFELIDEEKYEKRKGKDDKDFEIRIKIDKEKTPAENLKNVIEEFLENVSDVKTSGGVYLDLYKQEKHVTKIKDLTAAAFEKLDEALGKEVEEKDKDEKDKDEKDKDKEEKDEDKEEKDEDKEEKDEELEDEKKKELMDKIKGVTRMETGLYTANNISIGTPWLAYEVRGNSIYAELNNLQNPNGRNVFAKVILNDREVLRDVYYLSKGTDRPNVTIPVGVGGQNIALHFYFEDPNKPGNESVVEANFIGAMNGLNINQVVNGKARVAAFYDKAGGERLKGWGNPYIVDMQDKFLIYVANPGNNYDYSRMLAIMCGDQALPEDIGTSNRYILQKLSNGDYAIIIGGRLKDLVKNKFSVHLYSNDGQPGNFRAFIQAIGDAEGEGAEEDEKAEDNEEEEEGGKNKNGKNKKEKVNKKGKKNKDDEEEKEDDKEEGKEKGKEDDKEEDKKLSLLERLKEKGYKTEDLDEYDIDDDVLTDVDDDYDDYDD